MPVPTTETCSGPLLPLTELFCRVESPFYDRKGFLNDRIITPVLVYGMELIIPKATPLIQLELFQKRMQKRILSLPTRTADTAVHVLSGILPVEAQIHITALELFSSICNQADNSIEKNLARRQLIVKSNESSSWFIEIK